MRCSRVFGAPILRAENLDAALGSYAPRVGSAACAMVSVVLCFCSSCGFVLVEKWAESCCERAWARVEEEEGEEGILAVVVGRWKPGSAAGRGAVADERGGSLVAVGSGLVANALLNGRLLRAVRLRRHGGMHEAGMRDAGERASGFLRAALGRCRVR